MKIRMKGNSIRYRLSKTEVNRFLLEGYIEECVEFGPQTLKYALKLEKESNNLSASLANNTIIIYMPQKMATEWQDNNKVGFGDVDNQLSLLIEKDFQCLDNTLEDQSDNYPNPLMVC